MEEKIGIITGILTTMGATVGWILERKSNRADVFSKMQQAYDKFTEITDKKIDELNKEIEGLKDELEKCKETRNFLNK